ncbi:hypothetical protein GCM10010215_28720 [Streptomyces virginiae]|nr:hypothetical protein GCM10010215_28720 [Streptomyces virginiae]
MATEQQKEPRPGDAWVKEAALIGATLLVVACGAWIAAGFGASADDGPDPGSLVSFVVGLPGGTSPGPASPGTA